MMADKLSVKVNESDLADVRNLINRIKDPGAKTAQIRSINKGVRSAQKTSVDDIYGLLNLTKKNIRQRTRLVLAKRSNFAARMIIQSAGIPLINYGARHGVRGTTFKIWRSGSREKYKHAFVATMDNGHKGVFERNIYNPEYDGRLHITEKMGPGVATVFKNNKQIQTSASVKSAAVVLAEMDRQVQLILDNKI